MATMIEWVVLCLVIGLSQSAKISISSGTLSSTQGANSAANAYDADPATCAEAISGAGPHTLTLTSASVQYINAVFLTAADDKDIGEIKVKVNDKVIGQLSNLNKASAGYVTCSSLCYGDQVKIEVTGNTLKVCEVMVYPRDDFINLAAGKVATQSSSDKQNSAAKAIDGHSDPAFANGRCSSTKDAVDEEKVWWSVDLGKIYRIRMITIKNQDGVKASRLRDFKAMVAKDMTTEQTIDPAQFTICHEQVTAAGDAELLSLDCPYGTEGQYAVIYKERSWYLPLQICEVQVYGGPVQVNLANGKPTLQVNEVATNDFTKSAKGVDGIARTNETMTTYIVTPGTGSSEWWSVDLRSIYVISHVVITNLDTDNYDLLKKFKILLKLKRDELGMECHNQVAAIPRAVAQIIYCDAVSIGQYLYVVKEPANGDPLQFVEMEVYGEMFDGNIALLSTPRVAVPDTNLVPARAVDDIWGEYAAINHYTKSDLLGSAAWLVLTLPQRYLIGKIQLKNIDSCTPTTDCLNDLNLLVSETDPVEPIVDTVYPECNQLSTGSTQGQIVTLNCDPDPLWGQYVILYTTRVLKIAEMAVYPEHHLTNILYSQSTSTSDGATLTLDTHSSAIDGVRRMRSDVHECTVMHGASSVEWWKADLDNTYRIWEVNFYKNGDPIVLRDFELSVADTFDTNNIDGNTASVCHRQVDTYEFGYQANFRCHKRVTGQFLVLVNRAAFSKPFKFCEVEARGTVAAENLAHQNQTWMGGAWAPDAMSSALAVDGNSDPDYGSRSCSRTGTSRPEPDWWAVDLKTNYTVTLVRIVNRGDANGDWLADTQILVHPIFKPNDINATNFWLCHHHQGIWSQGEIITAVCSAESSGQFVMIRKPFVHGQPLVLCEVEVEGAPYVFNSTENLALGKRPSMSTEADSGTVTSSLAVDMIYDPIIEHGHCAETSGSQDVEWWAVDLEAVYQINRVVIAIDGEGIEFKSHDLVIYTKENYEQSDINTVYPNSHPDSASVNVSSSDFLECSNQTLSLLPGQMKIIDCVDDTALGTHVIISKENALNDPLVLCEVEIYGTYVRDAVTTPAPPTPPPTDPPTPPPTPPPTLEAPPPFDIMIIVYALIGVLVLAGVTAGVIVVVLKKKGIIGGGSEDISKAHGGAKEAWKDENRTVSVSSVKTNFAPDSEA